MSSEDKQLSWYVSFAKVGHLGSVIEVTVSYQRSITVFSSEEKSYFHLKKIREVKNSLTWSERMERPALGENREQENASDPSGSFATGYCLSNCNVRFAVGSKINF